MYYGSIVVIKRSGVDGSVFPVVNTECLFGRAEGCDIRVQLATVSKSHCRITINENYQVKFTYKKYDPVTSFREDPDPNA
jgi:hypothetical protein